MKLFGFIRIIFERQGPEKGTFLFFAECTFSTLHCECLHGVFNKDMKNDNCLCVISLSTLCVSIVVT